MRDVRYAQPWRSADDAYKRTMSQTHDQMYQAFYANIRRYFPPGTWKPEYEQYARILYAPTLSGDWPRLAMVRAIYQQITYLDPVVDKILLATIYLSLGFAGAIPWWMVGIVFGRDLLILSMVAWGLLFTSVRRFPPSIWGKISTFLQILAALLAMGDRYGIAVPKAATLWLMIAATIWSGIHYAWRGLQLLRKAKS